MKKSLGLTVLVFILLFALSGCSDLIRSRDSVIKDAARNFNQTVNNNIDDLTYHNELSHFGLQLKSGDKLEWTEDTSVSEADFSITINAEEFIQAGLDLTNFESPFYSYFKDTTTNMESLIYSYNINDEKVMYNNSDEAFEQLIRLIPDQVAAIKNDGYILTLDNGFKIHWNSDERVNKDLAFIIVADDLVKAGLDINKLDEWKVLKNNDANDSQVKLLKVFYLK